MQLYKLLLLVLAKSSSVLIKLTENKLSYVSYRFILN